MHRHKSNARNILQQIFMLIKRRYNGTVVFFRINNETFFNFDFLNEFKKLKITHETTVSYTPTQNNHAEKQNEILTMKTKTLRIETQLPVYL